ncbi:methylenetetrahydrofolate reductase [Gammaproteobacteria bacterium]|nr:methylenetetrahydrofolate reductase [Gammaproteobacteria bacterium]
MLNNNNFLFTSETTPDVSTDLSVCVKKVEDLINLADAVNVTDSPNCKSRLNSLLVASEIRKTGLEVILQLTGRDRNRVALESVLLGALSVDVNKVLCLSGDQPGEDGPVAVNELNSNGLIQLCKTISEGSLTDGTEIKNPLPIFSGAADDLYDQLSNPDAMSKLITKIEQGANFVQTQYCFEYDIIKEYSDKLSAERSFNDCKVLVGMGPLKSAKQGDWMRKNLWGINISDNILYQLETSDNPIETGEKICKELIEKIIHLPCVDGVHLMGPNCEKGSARIISNFR